MAFPVILFDDSGEFGNRIVTHCLLLSCCVSENIPFLNLCFWRYDHFFELSLLWTDSGAGSKVTPDLKKAAKSRLPRSHDASTCWKCRIRYLAEVHQRFVFDGFEIASPVATAVRLLQRTCKSRWFGCVAKSFYVERSFCLDGHRFRVLVPKSCESRFDIQAHYPIRRNLSWLRARLTVASHWLQTAQKIITTSYLSDCAYIGLHVRRGDYQVYENGRWYFPDQVYVEAAKQAVKGWESGCGKRPLLFVASNDNIDSLAATFQIEPVREKSLYADFCLLGLSRMIIGPPSTFSGTAAFLFGTPWQQIDIDLHGELTLSEPVEWSPRWY
jgi:hypothetical protein